MTNSDFAVACAADHRIVSEHCTPITQLLARITDKWSLLVIRVLERKPHRFNALRREVGQISQKVLASTLRDLELNGFVSRTVTLTKPPQVEYALTDLGRDFAVPVGVLSEWVVGNQTRIDAARSAYMAARADQPATGAAD